MPKSDFNPEFPTRASLRRARQEQQESRPPEEVANKKAAGTPSSGDDLDSTSEPKRQEAPKQAAAHSPESAAAAVPGKEKSVPGTAAVAPTVEAAPAPGPKIAPKSGKAQQSSSKPAEPATTKVPVVEAAAQGTRAKPAESMPAKAKQAAPGPKNTEAKRVAGAPTPASASGQGAGRAANRSKAAGVEAKPAAVKTTPVASPRVVPATATPAGAESRASAKGLKNAAAAPTEAADGPAQGDGLSTAEGRRQAFRDMNPAAGERDTFLRPEDETSFHAEQGFRGFLSRLGFNMEPSAQEVEERNWRRTVGTRLNEPKTISVVNGKGGANKTPTAVLLSAVFGRNSGEPVLVWDNNGTRGTLGWRTVQDSHARHSMDLLAAADKLKDTKVGNPIIHDYVHYQQEDCYSVLRTDPTLLASEQYVNATDFDVMHEIVSRFFSLTIIDSGNDESAERWMRMIDHTDQLVIASTTVEEHAEAGALLLEALAKRGGHYADLAKNAVVIISQHQPHGNSEQLDRIAHGFRRLARSVVTVPYDAALVKGQIRFDGLRPASRRAWLHATAAVAGALHH